MRRTVSGTCMSGPLSWRRIGSGSLGAEGGSGAGDPANAGWEAASSAAALAAWAASFASAASTACLAAAMRPSKGLPDSEQGKDAPSASALAAASNRIGAGGSAFIFRALQRNSDRVRWAFRRANSLVVSSRNCTSLPWWNTIRMSSSPRLRRSSSASDQSSPEIINASSSEFFPLMLSMVFLVCPRPLLSAAASVVLQSRCPYFFGSSSSPDRRKALITWSGVCSAHRLP